MSAHTPGPWLAARFGNGWFVYPRDGGKIVGDLTPVISEPDARLIAAAPDLLEAQTMGSQVNTPDFLEWIADRLVHVYGESPNIDFVHSLRDRAKAGRAAIAKATGVDDLGEPDARQSEIARARALYDKCDKP